ncbi:MAG: FAD-dependent oxidoreductase [Balneolaceae bacterium]|nr:FAD-dependent oxidoreductase [Balneolaceae bacterium]
MKKFDFLIVGSGFSGSITAMALTNMGYKVRLIEKKEHPRFTIGESSTPIADMILRDLADEYDLPFLKNLSRYGDWQNNYPEIICGLKRGFSYYHHKKGERFQSDEHHSKELLVAASENDLNSDTNWLRSDVDHFLVKKAVEKGVSYWDQTEVQKLSRDPKYDNWSVFLMKNQEISEMECKWIIDATGSPNFSTKFFNNRSSSDGFKTNSSAIFTHFNNADHWSDYLISNGFKTSDYPYNPDYSALHHLIEEGWIWMLRFNDDRLSAGILLDETDQEKRFDKDPNKIWDSVISQYPSLEKLFKNAIIADPPNQFLKTGRLQRRLERLFGNGWIALPHTAGFVDPLHSTGIAHTLSGVETILNIFRNNENNKSKIKDLNKYQDKVFNELSVIDLLVSICYRSRKYFELFTASSMLYFIASIRYEQRRLKGDIPDTFLCAGDSEIKQIIQETYIEFQDLFSGSMTDSEISKQVKKIKKRIEPFNTVGLMNSKANNMYRHTAVEL